MGGCGGCGGGGGGCRGVQRRGLTKLAGRAVWHPGVGWIALAPRFAEHRAPPKGGRKYCAEIGWVRWPQAQVIARSAHHHLLCVPPCDDDDSAEIARKQETGQIENLVTPRRPALHATQSGGRQWCHNITITAAVAVNRKGRARRRRRRLRHAEKGQAPSKARVGRCDWLLIAIRSVRNLSSLEYIFHYIGFSQIWREIWDMREYSVQRVKAGATE